MRMLRSILGLRRRSCPKVQDPIRQHPHENFVLTRSSLIHVLCQITSAFIGSLSHQDVLLNSTSPNILPNRHPYSHRKSWPQSTR